jgi:hypothetical protein
MIQRSNLGEDEFFCTCPDHPSGPANVMYDGYQVSFLGVKWLGLGFDHLHPSGIEVEKRVELYLYSPLGASWLVLGELYRTFLLLFGPSSGTFRDK